MVNGNSIKNKTPEIKSSFDVLCSKRDTVEKNIRKPEDMAVGNI